MKILRHWILGLFLGGIALGLTFGKHATGQQITNPSIVADGCAYNASPPTITTGQFALVQCDSTGNLRVTVSGGITPLPTAVAPIVSAAAESNHVLKASAGSALSISTTAGASAGYMLIFDATSAPGDGAVTPKYCIPVAANNFASAQWAVPAAFATGITVVFSTTGCFTKTASATAFFSGQVQ